MNISLRPDVREYVLSKVKSGEFPSEEAVVNALLSQACAREELSADDISELRDELDIEIAQANAGNFVEFNADDVIGDRRAVRKKVS